MAYREGLNKDRNISLDGAESGAILNDAWAPLEHYSGGILATFEYTHHLHQISINCKSGDYLIADNRGKLYSFSVRKNQYEVAKKATANGPICSMAHVHCKPCVALLAYATGSILVYDTSSKRTIASVQTPSGTGAKILRCHPSKPMAVVSDEANNLTVWDLRIMGSTLAMACQERVIDIQFIENGAMLIIVLESSGIHIYRSADMKVVLRCPFPDSERKPKWTAFAHAPSTVSGSLRFLLAGDNSLLYLWETETPFDITTDVEELAEDVPMCGLIGIANLPVSISKVVQMTALGEPALQPQILLKSDEGAIAILDAQGFGCGSIGIWTIIADLPSSLTKAASSIGSLASSGTTILVAGSDGACRLIDATACLGTGSNVATMLPTRTPYASAVRVPVYRTVDGRGQKVLVHKEASIVVRARVGINATEKIAEKKALAEAAKKKQVAEDKAEEARALREKLEKMTAEEARKELEAEKRAREKRIKAEKAEKALQEEKEMLKYTDVSDLKELDAIKRVDKSSSLAPVSKPHYSASGLSLHDLAQQAPLDKQLTEAKLRSFLASHHEFPPRYRQVIWRYLLKLPENTVAFADLVKQGPHRAFDTLHNKYPVRSRRLFNRLLGTCSSLAHWSPIFGEIAYLPQFVFPFTVVFGVDELATLETVMTIFMWWGHSWHATYPQPPVHIVDAVDSLLRLHDTKLHSHMCKRNAPAGIAGWAMISTLFTEILSRENWLRLMDHVFFNSSKQGYFYLAPVALLMAMRSTILGLDSPDDIMNACRTQHSFDFVYVSKILHSMIHNTPNKALAGAAVKSQFEELYGANSDSSHHEALDELEQARECLALQAGYPLFPLPSGRYPAYDGYPTFILDWQLRDRKAAMDLGKDTGFNEEDVLVQLQERVNKVNTSHQEFQSARSEAAKLEESARRAAVEKEKKQLRELHRIEEEISQQRMHSMSAAEKNAQEQMRALEAVRAETEAMMRLSEEQMLERANLALNLQRQREFAEAAEAAMQEKISSMHIRRSKEEWVMAVEKTLVDKEKELAVRDKLLAEHQRRQVEDAELRREQRRRQAEFQQEEESLIKVHDDMTAKMQKLMLARETDLLELERQRALRIAKEQADEALEAAERSQLLLKRQEAAILDQSRAQAAIAGSERSKAGYTDMLNVIRSDGERAAREEREKVLLGKLGSERPGIAAKAEILTEEINTRLERDIVAKVSLTSTVQDRVLERMTAEKTRDDPTAKGYLSDESFDNILGPLGEQVKAEVLQAENLPGIPDELNNSSLWAYDDPKEE